MMSDHKNRILTEDFVKFMLVLILLPWADCCSVSLSRSVIGKSNKSARRLAGNNDNFDEDAVVPYAAKIKYGLVSAPPQNVTPPMPQPVISECGHNKFYHTINSPGLGIVGGVNASYGQYPWIVRLRIGAADGNYTCGASIIGDRWMITAAHCASLALSPGTLIGIIGDWDSRQTDTYEYETTMSRIFVHDLYNSATFDYDFALLETTKFLNFSKNWYTQRICLPSSCSDGCAVSTVAYVSGWGTTIGRPTAPTARFLQSAYVNIADQAICASEYETSQTKITDRMICAGYPNGGVDSCYGDSGGPLMTVESGYYKLCGLTSFGKGCAQAGQYGVYSRLCMVIDWIKIITGL